MRSIFRRLVLIILCFLIPAVTQASSDYPRFAVQLRLGLNLISYATATGGTSSNRISPLVGIDAEWFIFTHVGLFVGVDYQTRGATLLSGQSASATFFDFPLGLVWRSGFFDRGEIGIHGGGYYSLPRGDLMAGGVLIQSTQSSFGAYLDLRTKFPLKEWISLGPLVWSKVGLSDSFKKSQFGTLQSIVEVGVGVLVAF